MEFTQQRTTRKGEVQTTAQQVEDEDPLLNELMQEREEAAKANADIAKTLNRQKITNKVAENLDEQPDKVDRVRVAYANYLRYLNTYNVSF